ncbi:hypothetical protein JDV02_009927 [Purpureocillium takamizusanense]|uniref:Pre-mRNA-splicing factor 38B n=1 Tax=Purpureocillium takamizusanense TaxID=2060973 RepID=A0A9Q8QTH1_9HYPO|nr:uncharacterized protein JDV02_009927 [Purpureocillium takamizusanense]UNI24157.1 hypothetical protein JDV02_009927 [Purpureocillium takamizusanense]
MADDFIPSDEHAARLLVDEATRGPGASGEKRPATMPRPNVRFLKKILRERCRAGQREGAAAHAGRIQPFHAKTEPRGGRAYSAQATDGRHTGHSGRHPSRDDELTSRRSRHDTHISGEERPCHHTTSRRSRSRSPRRRRSRSPERSRRRRDRSSSPRSKRASRQPAAASSDSDHENFGPAPPPTFKGRGTIGGAADLDRRFSSSYDPKMDVDPGSDGGDWDDTVEAYRDRLKLKQNQERRMRDAGFPEDQIRKMTQGEKTDKDVVWGKAGEKRDWDRGKDEGDTQPPTLFSEDYDG